MRTTILFLLILTAVPVYAQVQKDTTQVNLRPVIVTALKEEQPVGPYSQPEWTVHRRFPSTRVYLQTLPGEAEFEQWMEVRVPPKNSTNKTEIRFREELEFGLGEHLQLDLYLNSHQYRDNNNSTFTPMGWSAEIRWAPADWGALPANPTLYFEYIFNDGATSGEGGWDRIEPKLLLGGSIAPAWHWGLNLVSEWQLAPRDERAEEYKVTGAVSWSAIDEKLSLGPSALYVAEADRSGGTAVWEHGLLLGGSMQYRPLKKAYFSIEPLFGATDESKQLDMFIVFGWEL